MKYQERTLKPFQDNFIWIYQLFSYTVRYKNGQPTEVLYDFT